MRRTIPRPWHEAKRFFGDRVRYREINYDALEGADALLIVTEWNEFRRPDFGRMKQLMRQPRRSSTAATSTSRAHGELGFTYHLDRPASGRVEHGAAAWRGS